MAPLTSQLFAGDPLLQDIADDVNRVRIARGVNSPGPSVGRVQQALLLWDAGALPEHGADEDYGNETAAAVHRFKVQELGVPEAEVIDDVGPRTVQRLDEIALASEQPVPPPPPDVREDPVPPELIAAINALGPALLSVPGVTGIAPGFREEDGELVEELTVHVLVADASDLPPGLPTQVEGVPVAIMEMDILPMADENRYPEFRGGIRISHPSQRGGGTLAAIVKDSASGELLGLSCRHVVGEPGGGFPQVVWQPTEPPGVHVVGGGPVSPDDAVGAVVRAEFPRPIPGVVGAIVSDADAAVFKLDEATAQSVAQRPPSPAIVGDAPLGPNLIDAVKATAEPFAGQQVRKRGFVTQLRTGFVLSTHAMCPWIPGGPNHFLVEQALIVGSSSNPSGRFCQEGDSGSLVLDGLSPTAVGILYGANPSGTRAIMSKMPTVESRLGVKAAWA